MSAFINSAAHKFCQPVHKQLGGAIQLGAAILTARWAIQACFLPLASVAFFLAGFASASAAATSSVALASLPLGAGWARFFLPLPPALPSALPSPPPLLERSAAD